MDIYNEVMTIEDNNTIYNGFAELQTMDAVFPKHGTRIMTHAIVMTVRTRWIRCDRCNVTDAEVTEWFVAR